MGETATTVEQMMRYYESSGNQYPSEALGKGGAPTLRDFCQMYYEEAVAEGVKAEVAFAQAMKESAWLKFGGIVKSSSLILRDLEHWMEMRRDRQRVFLMSGQESELRSSI